MRQEYRNIEVSQSDTFIQEGRKTQHESSSSQEGSISGGGKEDRNGEERIQQAAAKDTVESQEKEQRDAGNDPDSI